MNNYRKNNAVIVIMVSFIFLIVSSLVYFFYFIDYEDEIDKKDSIFVNVTDEIIINDLVKKISDNSLFLLGTYEKDIDNINALESSQKLNIAFKSILKNVLDPYESNISSEMISDYFKNTFDSTIYWNKEDIYCECNNVLYSYDDSVDGYVYNKDHLGHGLIEITPFYSKVLDTKKKNELYVITMNYVWNNYSDIFGYTNRGYISYNDAISMNNSLFEIEVPDELDNDIDVDFYAIKEIEDNFDLYKDKLHKYIYTFKKVNDEYLLVNFEYEK